MWILPKQIISASALATEELISDCEEFSQVAEQSLMWRSKPSQLRTWRQRWKRESWIKHLSGRILKHSMQNHFVAWWTSYQVAIRVNHSQQQENDSEKMTPDISGRFCADQFELFAPEECSSRMSKDTSRWDCPQSSAIWKKMVTEQRGEYSVRLKSEQVTKERESSSTENWPTAAARDWKDSPGPWMYNATNPDGTDRNRTDQLARAVYHRQWPTPPTAEAQKISNKANYGQKCLSNHPSIRGLPDREKLKKDGKNQEQWPTPRAGDPGSRKPGTGGKILEEEAKKNWATPEAQNQTGYQTKNGQVFPRLGSQTLGKLNPSWVEQLMGVPVGWTQLPIHWLTE